MATLADNFLADLEELEDDFAEQERTIQFNNQSSSSSSSSSAAGGMNLKLGGGDADMGDGEGGEGGLGADKTSKLLQ